MSLAGSTIPAEKPLPRLLAPRQSIVPEALPEACCEPTEDDPLTEEDVEGPAVDMGRAGSLVSKFMLYPAKLQLHGALDL